MYHVDSLSILGAFLTGFAIVFTLMPHYIRAVLYACGIQPINTYLNNVGDHYTKGHTPTMGGLLILFATFVSFFVFLPEVNQTACLILASGIGFGALGFADDYKKVSQHNHAGLLIRSRFVLECILAIALVYWANQISSNAGYTKHLTFYGYTLELGVLYSILRVFAIVGASNAVNLTDGLDGLASIPSFCAFVFMGVFGAIVSSNMGGFHGYYYIVDGVTITTFCASICGSLLGFLWFNAKPARIFMGDIGSLFIGGTLGTVAMVLKAEILLLIVGIVFVIETCSTMIQIFSIRVLGKRVFKMAPIHHHYEKIGVPETLLVTRFWIISIIATMLGFCII